MAGNARLVVEVVATSAQFQADLGKAAAVAEAQAKRIERQIDDIKKRTLDFGKTALGALGISFGAEGVIRGFEAIGEKTIEEERSLNQLQAVLEATGHAAGVTAEQLAQIGKGVQLKSVFGDDEIRQAEASLLRFRTVQGDVFKDAIKLAPDLATALGTDLPNAAQLLGRALTDPERGLRQMREAGISLSDQQKDLVARMIESGDKIGAQRLIIDELAKSIGGLSEADTKGLYGATKRLSNAWGDLEKATGKKLFSDNNDIVNGLGLAFEGLAHKIDGVSLSWGSLIKTAILPSGFEYALRTVAGLFPGVNAEVRRQNAAKAPPANAAAEQETDANMAAETERLREAANQQYLDQAAALKARAANSATYYASELARQKFFIDQFNADLTFGYQRGTVTIEDFFAQQKLLAQQNQLATVADLDKQRKDQEALIASPHTTRDEREAARQRIAALDVQTNQSIYASQLKQYQLTQQQIEAVERLKDSYGELGAKVAEAAGDPVKAAELSFDVANRTFKRTLETRASRGTDEDRADAQAQLEQLGRLRQLTVDRAAESVRHTVDDITAQLLTLQGDTASATALRLRDANEDLRRSATTRGDTATLQRLDAIERLSVAQAKLNDLQTAYNTAVGELDVVQGRIDLGQQTGAITELDALKQKGEAAKAYADALRPVADAFDKIAQASGNPELIVNAEKFRLELDKIAAQADELRKKFQDVLVNNFDTGLTDLITGAKSARDAFKEIISGIQHDLTQIAVHNLDEQLFGKGGALGGASDFLAKIFGGKGLLGGNSSDQTAGAGPSSPIGDFLRRITGINPSGGTVGDVLNGFGMNDRSLGGGLGGIGDVGSLATLTSAGTLLTTAGTELTAGSTLLSSAAASLEAAAASLSASAGAGGLGGGVGTLFGPGAIDVGDNFAGGIPFFASGTKSAPGGLAVVGEKGPELVKLPAGTEVLPAEKTKRVTAALASLVRLRGFEDGGAPPVGAVSVVGESGAEVFVPNSAPAAPLAFASAPRVAELTTVTQRVHDIAREAPTSPAIGAVSVVGQNGPELLLPREPGVVVPHHDVAPRLLREIASAPLAQRRAALARAVDVDAPVQHVGAAAPSSLLPGSPIVTRMPEAPTIQLLAPPSTATMRSAAVEAIAPAPMPEIVTRMLSPALREIRVQQAEIGPQDAPAIVEVPRQQPRVSVAPEAHPRARTGISAPDIVVNRPPVAREISLAPLRSLEPGTIALLAPARERASTVLTTVAPLQQRHAVAVAQLERAAQPPSLLPPAVRMASAAAVLALPAERSIVVNATRSASAPILPLPLQRAAAPISPHVAPATPRAPTPPQALHAIVAPNVSIALSVADRAKATAIGERTERVERSLQREVESARERIEARTASARAELHTLEATHRDRIELRNASVRERLETRRERFAPMFVRLPREVAAKIAAQAAPSVHVVTPGTPANSQIAPLPAGRSIERERSSERVVERPGVARLELPRHLLSGLAFANGGEPPIGKASLVGEHGPELFVPKQSGDIVPAAVLNASRRGGDFHSTVNVFVQGNATTATANQIASEVTKRQRRVLTGGYL